MKSFLFAALSLTSVALASTNGESPRFEKRQATTGTATATRSGRPTTTATRQAGGTQLSSLPLASLTRIGTATTPEVTQPLPTTFTAGAIPPISGAPPLPAITGLNPADYPALDVLPPLDSPQVKQWIEEADLANAPDIPPTGLNGCSNTTYNAQAIKDAGPDGNCWWSCGGCTRATDISFCPDKEDFGVSYDDGPSPDTPRLLNLLEANKIKSTFFVVGSRALSRPEMLQTEYMLGHEISTHTFSHPPLTTLSNEAICAELGWTRQIIKDILGVTTTTFRPPYGDIDDRVRYIAMKMGMTPILWTQANGREFDTEDWQIGAGNVNATTVYNNFESILQMAPSMSNGFIVLAHDLYQQSVDLAVNFILPQIISAGQLSLKPITECLGQPAGNAYVETSDNKTAITQTTATLVGASGTGFVSFAAATGTSSSSQPSSSGSSSSNGSGSSNGGSSNGGSSNSGSGNNGGSSNQPTSAATQVTLMAGLVGATVLMSGLFMLA